MKLIIKIFYAVMAFALSIGLNGCNNNGETTSNNTNTETTEAKPNITSTAAAGKIIFEQKCAACHGADGTAGISDAANLQKSKMGDDSIEQIITKGKGNMPSFKTMLSENEMKQVTAYLKSLRK